MGKNTVMTGPQGLYALMVAHTLSLRNDETFS